MSSRSKTSLFSFGKKGNNDFLLFNEKDYFSSPQPASRETKKTSNKAKKQLALRRNLQAENGATDSDTENSPEVQYDDSYSGSEECSPGNPDVDKENDAQGLPPTGQRKSSKLKSVRQTISTWKQKLRKSTNRRSPLTDTPGGHTPNGRMTTPTSHVKLYSPFCIDTPPQPTMRNKIESHHAKPRRFQFSSPGRAKKSVSDGIQSLASMAEGLDAALATKE